MDHPCHKCGQSVEDGRPFCGQCGAPQIRVPIPEMPQAVAGNEAAATALESPPIFVGATTTKLAAENFPSLRPCALAAGVAALLMFLGLNPFISALGTGFLAATFSQRRNPAIAIRPASGGRLGAFSGLLLFGISTILETLAVVLLHKGAEIRSEMMEKIQQAASRYPGPEVQPFLDFVKSPDGFAFMMVGSLIFGLLAFVILGALGGAISGSFGRRNRP